MILEFTDRLRLQIDEALKFILKDYHPKYKQQDKVIRDVLEGFIRLEKDEIALLDSPLLQRLRNIAQTSLAVYTYPSVRHSRFEHSLGCLGMAQKIINSIRQRHALLNDSEIKEIRIAALLHDVGHGPFSHASEEIYGKYDEIIKVKQENPDLFGDAQPHEIISYFVVTSKVFMEKLWNKILDLYEPSMSKEKIILRHVNFDRVGQLIVGHPESKERKFVTQIINATFDVDKLDYIRRDGYFSGIQMGLDYDRLLCTIDLYKDPSSNEQVLCTDFGGATVLEQVAFNKMLLFSAIYHHHKVRASSLCFGSIFKILKNQNASIKDLKFESISDFLKVDDYEIFHTHHEDSLLNSYISKLKNRILLNRAFVLCTRSLDDEFSPAFVDMQGNADLTIECKNDILQEINTGSEKFDETEIYVDFPKPPSVEKITKATIIKLTPTDVVTLEDLYPTRGWATGYSQYRYRGYVFCKPGFEKEVARISKEIFSRRGLKTNPFAYKLAKIDTIL